MLVLWRHKLLKKYSSNIAKMQVGAVCTVLTALLIGVVAHSEGNKQPGLGINSSLHGYRPFPASDPWNTPVDKAELDPNSDVLIRSIGLTKPLHPDFGTLYNGVPSGIPYIVVSGNTPRLPVMFQYKDESDPGLYPIPADAPIEGGPTSNGDRHILMIDRDNKKLYELFSAFPLITNGKRSIKAGSGAIFDMTTNAPRPAGWTSADAAGLPIFPGLVRYDEVSEQKVIPHALRFTIVHSRHAYCAPARHFASPHSDPNLPPMGMRVRLKASVGISHYPASAQVILQCLKTYGMIVADNGSDWFVSGAPDPRWNDEELNSLKRIKGSDFEVIKMGPLTTK